MFLPIGDIPNPRGTPYVTYALICINVAVFILVSWPQMVGQPDLSDPMLREYLIALGVRGPVTAEQVLNSVSAYDLLVFRYGFRPAEPSIVALFSAMFLHGGLMHLFGNMLFLWIYGDNVEHRLGHVRYLLAYLGTGVAATLFFMAFNPDSHVPMIGASGAISGVLGCYFLWFPRNQIKVFIFFFPFIMQTVLIPARWVLGFYLLIDNLLPFLASGGGSGSGVAHGAHIGGFLGGLVLAWGVNRLPTLRSRQKLKEKLPREEPINLAEERVERFGPGDEIARQIRLGHPDRAAVLWFGLEGRIARSEVAAGDWLAIGEDLLNRRMYDEALSIFRRFVAERGNDPMLDRAYLGAGKAMLHKPRCVTSAYHYFLAALDVARTPGVADEVKLHIHAIQKLGNKES